MAFYSRPSCDNIGTSPHAQTKHDDVLAWKALRLISRASLPVFSKMLNPAAVGRGVQRKSGSDKASAAATAADKKEPAAPKLDLEDAVHELLPVRRARVPPAPLVLAAFSLPARACVCDLQ